ncbi:SPOR domain-containing protein [Novosphingobium sp. TH158]|uniref:SPOR domain-containing protein n=1 Tax=Novosphingobium sp. TH158 TaxID=2067455 RepID=UPI000C7BFDF2|nr:SPOR domain-containing protein [Novosphingobium sp. TH158]PLK25496.1 SPOR domain-containing protein [Novosphingobium sp. TH158]
MIEGAGRDPEDYGEGIEETVEATAYEADQPAELDLDADDRLPWLESSDDDYDEEGVDGTRVAAFVVGGLAALAALVYAIWWFSHRTPDPALVADGSTISAPSEPYKEAPKDPGGKSFTGQGDTSYSVAQGKDSQPKLAGGGEAPKPTIDAGTAPAAATSGGVGVQVGAYGSREKAEQAWSALVGRSAALKGVNHRVVEGTADIGKVYRLQAVAGDAAAAEALCSQLKAGGITCQVKR